MMNYTKPSDIEQESMSIIDRELALRGIVLSEEVRPIVKRVIHATADFEYAEHLYFTKDAVTVGQKALHHATIVTDTNMALAGINQNALHKLESKAYCFMAEPFIAEDAKARGVTRAFASMDYAAGQYPEAVYVIGNAPTALMRMADWIEKGYRPTLLIGVPVGFVNVVESKEYALKICEKHGIPAILSMGRKGGSGVAAAICNALLYASIERF